ncbi:MAG: phosphatidylinositol dimannoside acyltransferase [Actinomycetota bacterium]|jgi:KDO2-lipid IV(A) lauroyltransferase|nr:phosphatidylinositol dimannoside acyltransferase [Actinomycetota bacterium]
MRGQLTTLTYRGAARVAQAVPERLLPGLGRVVGRVGGWPQRANREMSARHQRRVTGRRDPAAVHGVFHWYGRYWLEILRLPADVRNGAVDPNFTIEGYEHVTEALAKGKGAILALPHLGGWEWAAAWMAKRGHHMLAVVEPLDPPELLEWFARQREAIGLEVVPIGADVSRTVLRALRDNRIVCLLSDRDLTGDGVEVEFFGERTTLPAGPATLALRTGASLLPVAVYFEDGRGHRGVVRPPISTARHGGLRDDIGRITQCLAHEFEALIRVAPEQWHLLQPNWPSDRE